MLARAVFLRYNNPDFGTHRVPGLHGGKRTAVFLTTHGQEVSVFTMERVYNFAPGPAMLPEEALRTAAAEMLDYQGTGMSVMEMSHRSKQYQAVFDESIQLLRDLMGIPDNYTVLLLQGGATAQFAAVPLNLLKTTADYADTGNFAHGALTQAKAYGDIRCAASSREANYTYIPAITPDMVNQDADYFYICTNNTIFGTRYPAVPETGKVPLVADMSSNILSEPYDVSRFGVIFAGAQKNIGPAGLTVVIVRNDLLGSPSPLCPKVINWSLQAEKGSMLNTPPTYSVYMMGLCLKWLKAQGGVAAIEQVNIEKAKLLYETLDQSGFYRPTADKGSRSRMNVTFTTPTPELDQQFVSEAAKKGLVSLKGHRLVGGLRASIYNAMPIEGVKALCEFMKAFEKENA